MPSTYRSKPGLAVLGLLLPLVVLAAGSRAEARAEIVVATSTAAVESAGYQGTVGSKHAVSLIALVAGRVQSVNARAGQRVRKGQPLVVLEPNDFKARLDAAESRLANARAARDEARRDYERFVPLAEKGVISAQTMDKTRARMLGAEAAEAEAAAGAREARTQFGYTVLRSPIDGIVTDKHVDPGDFTQPGLPSEVGFPSGRTLMTVYDPAALWFEARLPERLAATLRVGSPVRVTVPAAGKSLDSVVLEVLPAVDAVSRSFLVRTSLAADRALQPGMSGKLRFAVGGRGAVTVPESALVERGQLDAVFVVRKDGRASLRLVRPGHRENGRAEILSGIAAGERLVNHPRANLRDGDVP